MRSRDSHTVESGVRTVAFWVLSVALSVTMAVHPALAHGVDPSPEEECHPLEPDGPEHCHTTPTEGTNRFVLAVGAVLLLPVFVLVALLTPFGSKSGESGDTPPFPERGEPSR